MSYPSASLEGGSRLGSTWSEVGAPSRDKVWRHIRALRQQPPGRANKGSRRRIFGSALEQAEQLFEAAAMVGYASRPLLLFYGLSQAGRAIAAASISADNNSYQLVGHGIKNPDLSSNNVLYELTVVDAGRGSFTQLAPMLRSGSLPQGAPLGQVWATIPDLPFQLNTRGAEYKRALTYQRETVATGMIVGKVCRLPWRFAAATTEAEIIAFLDDYPSLGGSDATTLFLDTNTPDGTGGGCVLRTWPRPQDIAELAPLTAFEQTKQDFEILESRFVQPYRGDNERLAFPAIGGSDLPLHPLLAWWAVLFSLSMLARYEPAGWTGHLDIDASPDAITLEGALDRALDTCPELILHAIRAVSA